MKYRMTEEELGQLKTAAQTPGLILIGGVPCDFARDASMAVWSRIAARVGCKVDSIGPSGRDPMDFEGDPL